MLCCPTKQSQTKTKTKKRQTTKVAALFRESNLVLEPSSDFNSIWKMTKESGVMDASRILSALVISHQCRAWELPTIHPNWLPIVLFPSCAQTGSSLSCRRSTSTTLCLRTALVVVTPFTNTDSRYTATRETHLSRQLLVFP